MLSFLSNIFQKKKQEQETAKEIAERETKEQAIEFIEKQKAIIIKEEEEHLLNSEHRLKKLAYFSLIFKNNLITDIYDQTVILHDIFKNDSTLQRNKLEQHHYMYTDSLLDMLSKLEQNVIQENKMCDIYLLKTNKTISTLQKALKESNDSINKYKSLFVDYSEYISIQLWSLYNMIIDEFIDFRYIESFRLIHMGKRINPVHVEFKLNSDIYSKIIKQNNVYYMHDDYNVDSTLLQNLYKNKFVIEYVGILKAYNNETFEVFLDVYSNKYFYYNVSKYTFDYFELDDNKLLLNLMSDNNSKAINISKDIDFYKGELQKYNNIKENALINQFNDDIVNTLNDYIKKINDIDFVENLKKVDVDTETLRTMLNIEKLEI